MEKFADLCCVCRTEVEGGPPVGSNEKGCFSDRSLRASPIDLETRKFRRDVSGELVIVSPAIEWVRALHT